MGLKERQRERKKEKEKEKEKEKKSAHPFGAPEKTDWQDSSYLCRLRSRHTTTNLNKCSLYGFSLISGIRTQMTMTGYFLRQCSFVSSYKSAAQTLQLLNIYL